MRTLLAVIVFAALSARAASKPIVPVGDYHTHLISPTIAKIAFEPALPAIDVPANVAQVLRAQEAAWNDKTKLAALLTDDVVALNPDNQDLPTWLSGREAVAGFLAMEFEDAYRITPVALRDDGATKQVAGYFTRAEQHLGHVLLTIKDGKIASEAISFPGPPVRKPVTADQLVPLLDDAGIRRAVVLSVAYWWGSPFNTQPAADEAAAVRAENDWVVAQVAKYPDRLVAFCSFNPLKDYAVAELERCAALPHVKGIKLHFGNSQADIRKPEQREKVARVFRAANAHHLALVVHMWMDPAYEEEGKQYVDVFLSDLLPLAPDIPIQIAHMAGGGRSTDTALAVFADAIAKKDPRTKNLYFDVATLTAGQTKEGLQRDAMRMRQIGLQRILYGTDTTPPQPPMRQSWGLFRALVPLTDDELRIIANNVTPYLE